MHDGIALASMNVLPVGLANAGPQPAAKAVDNAPMSDITPFGMRVSGRPSFSMAVPSCCTDPAEPTPLN